MSSIFGPSGGVEALAGDWRVLFGGGIVTWRLDEMGFAEDVSGWNERMGDAEFREVVEEVGFKRLACRESRR